jgi:hypothetical protein
LLRTGRKVKVLTWNEGVEDYPEVK